MKRVNFVCGALCAALVATAVADDNVATVLGETLSRTKLDAEVQKVIELQSKGQTIPEEYLEMVKSQVAKQLVGQFVASTALTKKAASLGYTVEQADLDAFFNEIISRFAGHPNLPKSIDEMAEDNPFGKERGLADIREQTLIRKMINGEVVAKDTTDYSAEAKEIIKEIEIENAKVFDDAGALKKITELKAQIEAVPEAERAAKFAEVAQAESACPSGRKGGSLGEFGHGQMVPEFDKAAFEADIGAVVGPVKTAFGYHLIMTTKKTAAVEGKSETCEASHILIKTGTAQKVPELSQIIDELKKQANAQKIGEFITDIIKSAKPELADEYKDIIEE